MTDLELNDIRERVRTLLNTNPNVHVNIVTTSPKRTLKGDPATILGVYQYIFRLEERSTGAVRVHAIPYTDLITKAIEIQELNTLAL